MNKLKHIIFIFLICYSMTGCSTTDMLRSQYLNEEAGKRTLTKELLLCKADPEYIGNLHKSIFPRQEMYSLQEILYNGDVKMAITGCLDTAVPIQSGAQIELKRIVHRGYFEGSSTYAYGYVEHPIKNQRVAFEILLMSKDQSGACNNPNAVFNLTRADCKYYFDKLAFPWK